MTDFVFYFSQGLEHILDVEALDHLFFIVAFSLCFSIRQWKPLLGSVTAFTIGHSLTLFLSVSKIVTISPTLIETLIPITILLSCLANFWLLRKRSPKSIPWTLYVIILFFGLIHGMGFSNYLRGLLFDESIFTPLLGFNLGIELAQIIILMVFLLLKTALYRFGIPQKPLLFGINLVIIIGVLNMLFPLF